MERPSFQGEFMKGFDRAQTAYDNMMPPEESDFDEDEEPKEENDNFDIDKYEDQQQVLAVQRDYERFLNWLYK